MSVQISVTEARASLPEVIDRVLAGEEITITRHGKAVVVMVQPEALRVRRIGQLHADAERLRLLLEDGRSRSLSPEGGLTPAQADEMIGELRHARARR